MINYLYDYLLLGTGTALVLAGIFIIPKKDEPQKPAPKSILGQFYNLHYKYSLEHQPLSRLSLLAVMAAIAAIILMDFGVRWYGYGLIALGIIFFAADIYNRFKKRNKPRTNWRPFLGLLLPATILLMGGFASIGDPQLSYSFAAAGIACAGIDVAYKLK